MLALAELCQSYWYPLYAYLRRPGQLLREEIAHTVEDPSRVDGELRHLLSVLSGA